MFWWLRNRIFWEPIPPQLCQVFFRKMMDVCSESFPMESMFPKFDLPIVQRQKPQVVVILKPQEIPVQPLGDLRNFSKLETKKPKKWWSNFWMPEF